jgi:ribosomal protein S18 acetylase RimI-like enzyme
VAPELTVRDGTAADRDFVMATARRLAAFAPPPWRSAEEIVAGEVQYLQNFFDGRLKGPLLLVATVGDAPHRAEPQQTPPMDQPQPVGFALLEPAIDYFTGESHAHLGMIAVIEAAEGTGVSTALMTAAERRARAQGFSKITLNVFEGNARARRFYERLGFNVEIVRYLKVLA